MITIIKLINSNLYIYTYIHLYFLSNLYIHLYFSQNLQHRLYSNSTKIKNSHTNVTCQKNTFRALFRLQLIKNIFNIRILDKLLSNFSTYDSSLINFYMYLASRCYLVETQIEVMQIFVQ